MPRALLVALIALLSTPAFAASSTVTLQNDTFVSGAAGAVAIDITTGEAWGATFKVEPSQTPIRLKKLQGLFAGNPAFAGTECGAFSVKVYEDTGINAPAPDGAAIFDSMTAGEYTFDIPANDGALQEIDFSTFTPIWVDTPGFRVEIHAESNMCLMSATGNMHFPVLAVDADGVSPGMNTLYAYDIPNAHFAWFETGALGASGDYILRAQVETTGCTPNCGGKECGSDGCQGSCGTCPGGNPCVAGQCCTPDCNGRECGSDGCGGACGSCGAGTTCTVAGVCECVADCDGKECGPDGCGGSCGSCGADGSCEAGACVASPDVTEPDETEPDVSEPDVSGPEAVEPDVSEPDGTAPGEVEEDDTVVPEVSGTLRVDSIVPNHGLSTTTTDVVILGAGFEAGVTVRLDADHITVNHVEATTIEATVPIGLASGAKTLIVQNPDGVPITLAAAYTVDPTDVVSTGSGSGCEVGDRSLPAIPALLALSLSLVLLRRRVPREG